jgi:hypothetical protein
VGTLPVSTELAEVQTSRRGEHSRCAETTSGSWAGSTSRFPSLLRELVAAGPEEVLEPEREELLAGLWRLIARSFRHEGPFDFGDNQPMASYNLGGEEIYASEN